MPTAFRTDGSPTETLNPQELAGLKTPLIVVPGTAFTSLVANQYGFVNASRASAGIQFLNSGAPEREFYSGVVPDSWVDREVDLTLAFSAVGLGAQGPYRAVWNFNFTNGGVTLPSVPSEDVGVIETTVLTGFLLTFNALGLAVGRDSSHVDDTETLGLNFEFAVLRLNGT